MTRAEMRRQKRESEKEHTITYNLTKAQLDQMVNSLVDVYKRQDIGSPLGKTLWGLLLVVGVDLTTVKTHDQKGEIGRYE